MAFNMSFNASWTATIEKERAAAARQRALLRAKSEGTLTSASAAKQHGEGAHRHRRRKVDKPKQYSAAYITGIASAGYGNAAICPLPHREGSNSVRPNEMWPVTDGSVLPKPERAPREYPDNYVFAVGDPTGHMQWPKDVTHKGEKSKDRLTRLLREAEEEKEALKNPPALRPPPSPLRPNLVPDNTLRQQSSLPPRRTNRKATSTNMGFMIWPQDASHLAGIGGSYI